MSHLFLFFVRGGKPVYLMHHFICFHIGMEFNHWDLFCSTYFSLGVWDFIFVDIWKERIVSCQVIVIEGST